MHVKERMPLRLSWYWQYDIISVAGACEEEDASKIVMVLAV